MKKHIAVFVAVILIFTNIQLIMGKNTTYSGNEIYKEVYKNIDFEDINNHWAKKYINKMSALYVIKGTGNYNFNPDDSLTIEQSMILLSRLMGLESEAQSNGEASIRNVDTGNYKILGTYDYYVRGYVDVALNNNIITREEYDEITNLNENEEERIDINVEQKLLFYEKDYDLSQAQLDNIENQLIEKETKKYTIGKPITRERIATWVARIMNLEPISGQTQQLVYNLKDWKEIDTKNLPIIEAVIQSKIMVGNTNNEFNPKGTLKRGEMTKVLDFISEDFLIQQGYTINTGIINEIYEVDTVETDKYEDKDLKIDKKIFEINNDDDTSINIESKVSNNGSNENGFIVYKNNSLALPKDLKESDYIKYFIDPQGEVTLVEVLDKNIINIEGLVQDVDSDKNIIIIKDSNDNIYDFVLASGANITTNGTKVNLEELLYGEEVKLTINNSKVTDIIGYIEEGEPGYIDKGDRVYVGKALYIDDTNKKLTIIYRENEKEFDIDEFVNIIKNNSSITFNSINEGDTLRLEFDEYDTTYPSRIYVSTNDKELSNIYKAKINNYNTSRNELIISDVKNYKNSNWESISDYTKIKLDYNTDIYKDNIVLQSEKLNDYNGKEVYIATIKSYGSEVAHKIILKTDYESSFNDKLDNISFGFKNIEIDYNNIEFDYDSTIIVKDGNLIHPYNLQNGDTLSVIAQGMDYPLATFIQVEEAPNIGINIYRGKMKDINRYSITLHDFDKIKNNVWDYENSDTDFNISNDTFIIDTRNGYREVSVENFTNSRYLGNNYYNKNDYFDEYIYALEYDNHIIGINMIDINTEAEVLSSSDIDSIDVIKNKLTITNIKDYDRLNEKWNTNDSDIELDLSETMIVKDGKVIKPYQISQNDKLYVLRKNHKAYVVIVR